MPVSGRLAGTVCILCSPPLLPWQLCLSLTKLHVFSYILAVHLGLSHNSIQRLIFACATTDIAPMI